VISYNCYWITVIAGFFLIRYKEVKGHLPFMKAKTFPQGAVGENQSGTSSAIFERNSDDEKEPKKVVVPATRTISDES